MACLYASHANDAFIAVGSKFLIDAGSRAFLYAYAASIAELSIGSRDGEKPLAGMQGLHVGHLANARAKQSHMLIALRRMRSLQCIPKIFPE